MLLQTVLVWSSYFPPISPLPAVAVLLATLGIIVCRLFFRIWVQCWFCQAYSKVLWKDSGGWTCPSCEQYNGFTKDGDYNKEIPAMHEYNTPKCRAMSPVVMPNGQSPAHSICKSCTNKLDMKVKMLGAFKPVDENNFDKEIAAYRSVLDNIYGICSRCELVVKQRLSAINKSLGIRPAYFKCSGQLPAFGKVPSIKSMYAKSNGAISLVGSVKPSVETTVDKFPKRAVIVCLLISFVMWCNDVDRLSRDSGNDDLLIFNRFGFPVFDWLHINSGVELLFAIVGISLQLFSLFRRRIFLIIDGISAICWLVVVVLYVIPILLTLSLEQSQEILVLQTLLSTMNCVLVFWALFLPRRVSCPRKFGRKKSSRSLKTSPKSLSTATYFAKRPNCTRSPSFCSDSFLSFSPNKMSNDCEYLRGRLSSLSLNQPSKLRLSSTNCTTLRQSNVVPMERRMEKRPPSLFSQFGEGSIGGSLTPNKMAYRHRNLADSRQLSSSPSASTSFTFCL